MTDATDDRVQPAPEGAQPSSPVPDAAGESAPAVYVDPVLDAPPADAPQPFTAPQTFTQAERVGRGIALALLVIPAGVIVWTVLWNVGFIASIVSWGVAFGAVWLYRFGSKARITRAAFWGIISIVVVTVVLSLLAGIFTDLVSTLKIPLGDALTDPRVWGLFFDNVLTNGDMWQAYLPSIGLALLFAALGCFTTLRRVSRESRA